MRAWGLEILCLTPAEYSNTLTGVLLPEGHDADRLRGVILERFDMSLGTGLDKLQGRVFRIGHLGDFNELMLAGTLCGVEMGLATAEIPHTKGGVMAALDYRRRTVHFSGVGGKDCLPKERAVPYSMRIVGETTGTEPAAAPAAAAEFKQKHPREFRIRRYQNRSCERFIQIF